MKQDKPRKKSPQSIDHILKDWPFDPANVNVRLLELSSREILQMRIDMGVLQLEVSGRPDGVHPHGNTTYYEYLRKKAKSDRDFMLNEEHCIEVDREFVQFYHRRVCWLQLKEFDRAVKDADHTLGLMDFCKQFSPDEEWTISHEQYRPFVLYHRTQAAALAELTDGDEAAPVRAIDEVDRGLEQLRELFVQYEAEEQFEEDELVLRLREFRDGLKAKYEVEDSLEVQLSRAIEEEDYELAAQLRDQIAEANILAETDFDEADMEFLNDPPTDAESGGNFSR